MEGRKLASEIESNGRSGTKFFTYGWVMVAITFCTAIVSQGFGLAGYSLLRVPMTGSLGVSATLVSTAFSIFTLLTGIGGIAVGPFIERFSLRWALVIGAVFFGGGYLLLAVMTEPWMMFVAYFIMGIGSAFSGPLIITGVASNWFIKRRGLATGVIWAAGFPGTLFCSALVPRVVESSSWQDAALVLAGLSFAILLIASFFLKWRPQELGLLPDGMTQAEADELAKHNSDVKLAGLTRAQAMKTVTFWLLVVAVFLVGVGQMGPSQNFSIFLMSSGCDIAFVGAFVSFSSLSGVIGKIGIGFLVDKIGSKKSFVIATALVVAALCILVLSNGNTALLYLGAFGFGAGSSGSIICFSTLTAKYLGVKHYGSVWGAIFMFKPVSDSVGIPLITAIGLSAVGWTGAFGIAAAVCVASAVLLCLTRKEKALIAIEQEGAA